MCSEISTGVGVLLGMPWRGWLAWRSLLLSLAQLQWGGMLTSWIFQATMNLLGILVPKEFAGKSVSEMSAGGQAEGLQSTLRQLANYLERGSWLLLRAES